MDISFADINTWENLCHKDPECTPFQTPLWMDISCRYLGAELKPFLLKHNSESALWPMLVKKSKLGPVLFRPFGSYGGLISETVLSENFHNNLKKTFKYKAINEVINPYSKNKFTLGETGSHEAYFIDINALKPDNITSHWRKGHKQNLKSAQKRGLEVVEGSLSENLSSYFNLYEKTFNKWKNPRGAMYSKKIFQLIEKKIGAQKSFFKLWECRHNKQLISGIIVFYFQKRAYAWHGATDPDFYRFYPVQLLQFHIIKHALENGMDVYDLGPNPGLKGVGSHKRGFGARELEVTHFVNSNPARKVLSPLKKFLKK